MDRAYEGDETRQTARDVGLKPVVPPKRNRRNPWRYNKTCQTSKRSPTFLSTHQGFMPNRDALR